MYTFKIEVTDKEEKTYEGMGLTLFGAFKDIGLKLSTIGEEKFDAGIPSKFFLARYGKNVIEHEEDKLILGLFNFTRKIGEASEDLPKDVETVRMLMAVLVDADSLMHGLKVMLGAQKAEEAMKN